MWMDRTIQKAEVVRLDNKQTNKQQTNQSNKQMTKLYVIYRRYNLD